MSDPFDHDGEVARRHAADLARLLVEHARVCLAESVDLSRQAEADANIAAERLRHAVRQQRLWTKRLWIATVRCERARAL